jgi:hypothetical protein
MCKSYLSVDIDYWNVFTGTNQLEKDITRIISFAKSNYIPINVVMNHQQLLKFVNYSVARKLINIDQHSDIVADPKMLDCGTWVSYVNWRKEGKYLWVRSYKNLGDVNTWQNKLVKKKNQWKWGCDWLEADRAIYKHPSLALSFLNKNVAGIGICLSPSYSRFDVYNMSRRLLSGLPYVRGRVNENSMGTNRLPTLIKSI